MEKTRITVEKTDKGIKEITYNDGYGRVTAEFKRETVFIGGYWDGNGGEWSEDWLGVDLDRAAVEHLHGKLGAWLKQTAKDDK